MKKQKAVVLVSCLAVVAVGFAVVLSPAAQRHFEERGRFWNLQKPIRVERSLEWNDSGSLAWNHGGTVGITLIDKQGTRMQFCVDLRAMVDDIDRNTNPTLGRVFLDVWHPNARGAFLTARRGYAEKRIVAILDDWLQSSEAPPLQTEDSVIDYYRTPSEFSQATRPQRHLINRVLEALRPRD